MRSPFKLSFFRVKIVRRGAAISNRAASAALFCGARRIRWAGTICSPIGATRTECVPTPRIRRPPQKSAALAALFDLGYAPP